MQDLMAIAFISLLISITCLMAQYGYHLTNLMDRYPITTQAVLIGFIIISALGLINSFSDGYLFH
jgi:hypothetical protein